MPIRLEPCLARLPIRRYHLHESSRHNPARPGIVRCDESRHSMTATAKFPVEIRNAFAEFF
jgi:hypothetical protein